MTELIDERAIREKFEQLKKLVADESSTTADARKAGLVFAELAEIAYIELVKLMHRAAR